MAINISNQKHRDAVVAFEAVVPKREVAFVDPKGKPVHTQKLLKTDIEHDLAAIQKKKKDLNAVAKALVCAAIAITASSSPCWAGVMPLAVAAAVCE